MRKKPYRNFSQVSLLSLAVGMSSAAMAAEKRVLEETVVTAQKRTESVQDVPIAISAFSAGALQDLGVSSVSGLSNYTPNVTLDAGSPFSSSPSVLTAYIRGIGQDDFAFNLDPGVGVYIDGVYLARTVGANADLLDVERIEILKGPQGTLFGRNSIGGAISIITRRPSEEVHAKVEVIVGDYDRLDVRGSVDIPLIEDKLLSSISFASTGRDGYVKRIPYPADGPYVVDPLTAVPRSGIGSSDTEGGEDSWTARVKLLWLASDNLDITFSGDYQKVDQEGSASTLIDTFNLEGAPGELFGTAYNLCINVPTSALPTDIGGNIAAMCGIRGTSGTSIAEANIDGNPATNRLTYDDRFITGDIDKTYATGPSFSRLENWGISIIADYNFGESASLKSITGYRDFSWSSALDSDGSPVTLIEPGFKMNQEQFSQEFQLTGSAFSDNLDYVVGAYYFTEEGDLHDFVPFAEGLLQIDGPNDFDTESWALFTHLNYRFSDRLSMTLGARYTEEEKEFEGFQRDPNGFLYKLVLGVQLEDIAPVHSAILGFPDPSDPLRFYPPGTNKKSFDNFSPRVGLEYRFTDEVMTYASFSQGYKTGSWTTRLSAPLAEAPDFDEEDADSYELGVKSELFDRTVRLNAALFYTEYDGIQLTQSEGISPTTLNAGEAEIQGAEIELQWLATDNLTVATSVGYIDDEYTFKEEGTTAGDDLPKTPEWKFNFSPRYEISLANGTAVVLNAAYTYTSELENNTENTVQLQRDAVEMLNASVTYQGPDDRWYVTLGGTNLLDERYITTGQFQQGGGLYYGTYSRPTEWFVKLGFEF